MSPTPSALTVGLIVAVCGLPVGAVSAEPVAHWRFDAEHVRDARAKALAGSRDAMIAGPVRLRPGFSPGALLIDGERSRVAVDGLDPAAPSSPLPLKAMTVEAWVAIEKTVEWGGIVGAVRDGGEDKGGWELGFRQSNFSFGLAGQGGDDRTYTRSRTSLEWGRWYHVVGTYDGVEQRLYVDGRLEASSAAEQGEINYARRVSCVIGGLEHVHRRLWIHEIRILDLALGADDVASRYRARRELFPPLLEITVGPTVERLDRETARIAWDTARPGATVLAFGDALPLPSFKVYDETPRTSHTVTIEGLGRETLYHYRVASSARGSNVQSSRLFEFDSTFDYTVPPPTLNPAAYPSGREPSVYARLAERVLARSSIQQGYCLILGCETGELAYEIARRTRLNVVCLDDDDARIAAVRERLDEAGVYGVRVSVHRGSLEKLPYADYMANLVLSERVVATGRLPTPGSEVLRVLRPCGGVACFGGPAGESRAALTREKLEQWLARGHVSASAGVKVEIVDRGFVAGPAGATPWAYLEREAIPGSGSWTHQYGDPGNSSCSQDELVAGSMRVLWFGKPGPRPMVDRGTRAPAPLSANGRLFVQGDRRLFGLDAYNGTILWTLEIPDLRRANMPRDGSNMAATDDSLYVAVRGRCWRLDAGTGKRLSVFEPPPPVTASPEEEGDLASVEYDWGFLACVGDILYGSVVRRGGIYIGADGEWYDKKGAESMKVVSDALFALDRKTGETRWIRRGGLAINSTLSLGDGRLYMVESRNPTARKARAGRLGDELRNDRYLVAMDARTGKDLWERYYDFDEGRYVFYLSYARDTLLALSTSDKYHVYAFDAGEGKLLWKKSYGWNRDHHGGAMQHPVIIDDVVYAEPNGFQLRSGEEVHRNLPERSGCGAMSGSKGALFFRDGDHSMWDFKANERRKWSGIRPGCWLGIINAGGIVLAPETSAGCYCANPIQTSIAFYPTGDD